MIPTYFTARLAARKRLTSHCGQLGRPSARTSRLRRFYPMPKTGYGIKADSQNNLYFMDFPDQNI